MMDGLIDVLIDGLNVVSTVCFISLLIVELMLHAMYTQPHSHTLTPSHSLSLSHSLSHSLSLGTKNRLGVHPKKCLQWLRLAPYFIYVTLERCLLCFALLCLSKDIFTFEYVRDFTCNTNSYGLVDQA